MISLLTEPKLGFSYIVVEHTAEIRAIIEQEKFFFSGSDRLEFSAISHPHKQFEWLASRYAIHHLLAHNEIIYRGLWKDEAGKPFLEGSDYHFSLTHTQGYAAAAIHPTLPIGIDIEVVSGKLARVAHKFLSKTELFHAQSLEKLCVYWVAKEALYKLHGKKGEISFAENLAIEPFETDEDNFWTKGGIHLPNSTTQHRIFVQKIEDLYLAIAI